MKKIFSISLILTFLSLPITYAGELYSCTDRNGNPIVTDSPQDGMTNCQIKDSYDDPTPTQKYVNKMRNDYSNKIVEIQSDIERESRKAREASEAREKIYYKEQCDTAKRKETYYRYQWRNAKTDDDTMFWKRMLDGIDEICNKAR